MSRVVLRRGVEIEDPLEVALAFLTAYSIEESPTMSFDESDLRRANRGGARISAVQIATILERRGAIERELGRIEPDASLAVERGSVGAAGAAVRRIRGHPRSRLLEDDEGAAPEAAGADPDARQRRAGVPGGGRPGHRLSFGERAIALVRGYKGDLDRNRVRAARARGGAREPWIRGSPRFGSSTS